MFLIKNDIKRLVRDALKEQKNNITIRKLRKDDFDEIDKNIEQVFKKTNLRRQAIWSMMGNIDPELSIVALVDGKLAGFYFLSEEDIPQIPSDAYEKLKNKRGVEGVALGVFEPYRNMGVGKKLIDYTQNMDYDYIWGMQLKSLENINDWLKRRKIYYENPDLYITYRILK